jgi:hypothetical protein
MLRISLVLGAVLAIALPASVASAQSDKLRVFFPKDCQQNVYKPKSFVVTCADANFEVRKVKYSSYGEKVARGTGTARINDCEPNCAAGTFKKYPVRFKLSRVRQCGDVPQFRRLTVVFTGDRPAGEDRRMRQPFRCADAPTR